MDINQTITETVLELQSWRGQRRHGDAGEHIKGGFYLWGLRDVFLQKQRELKFTRGVRDITGNGTKNLLGRGNSICKGLVEKWSLCCQGLKRARLARTKREAKHFMKKAYRPGHVGPGVPYLKEMGGR